MKYCADTCLYMYIYIGVLPPTNNSMYTNCYQVIIACL